MAPKSYSEVVKGARSHLHAVQAGQASTTAAPHTAPLRPPLLSSFPPLALPGVLRAAAESRSSRTWAEALKGTKKSADPPNRPSVAVETDDKKPTIATCPAAAPADMAPPGATLEDIQVSPCPSEGATAAAAPSSSASSSEPAPPRARAKVAPASRSLGPNASLWFNPEGYDLIIWCRGLHWKVHRSVLVEMSEWMEKYMPPAAQSGQPVPWTLDSWDPGRLGAVLEYMYLEDYQGGAYDPGRPLDTTPVLTAAATFLAGTAALVRPMMDHALADLEAAAAALRRLAPALRRARRLDDFELGVRRALLLMYDEPDQWRVRALRIAMGRLAAACLPPVLQSPRWAGGYAPLWGSLRLRVVADHKWLASAGLCPASAVILAGFEHMDVLWVRYRREGWRPSDDLMFPEREGEVADRPGPPPAEATPPPPPFSSPLRSAAGKKKSKAIPIVRPDGTLAPIPGQGPQGEAPEPEAAAQPGPSSAETSTASTSNGAGDPFAADPTAPVVPDPDAPPGSAAWWAYLSRQPYASLLPAPFFVRPQPGGPGGPRSAAGETSTGEPSESAASDDAGSAFGQPEDAPDSPTTHPASEPSAGADDKPPAPAGPPPDDRLAELYVGFGGPDDQVTPRPPSHERARAAGGAGDEDEAATPTAASSSSGRG